MFSWFQILILLKLFILYTCALQHHQCCNLLNVIQANWKEIWLISNHLFCHLIKMFCRIVLKAIQMITLYWRITWRALDIVDAIKCIQILIKLMKNQSFKLFCTFVCINIVKITFTSNKSMCNWFHAWVVCVRICCFQILYGWTCMLVLCKCKAVYMLAKLLLCQQMLYVYIHCQ